MINTKYIIVIGIIICSAILYYLYRELSSVKKLFVPIYQKIILLDNKMAKLDKRRMLQYGHKNDSPVFSITYQSDVAKNGDLSIRYSDISDTEARRILEKINRVKKESKSSCTPTLAQSKKGISDFGTSKNEFEDCSLDGSLVKNTIFEPQNEIDFTDYFEKNLDKLINRPKIVDIEKMEYDNILNELSKDGEFKDIKVDKEIVKNISESLLKNRNISEDLWENMTESTKPPKSDTHQDKEVV